MFKVLIALDGSPQSAQILGLATELLGSRQTQTTVLHVIPRHLIYGKGGPVVVETYNPQEERVHAAALLNEAAQTLLHLPVHGSDHTFIIADGCCADQGQMASSQGAIGPAIAPPIW